MNGQRPGAGIAGVVLAGGQGQRMGGLDKGLRPLRGKPMVAWVLERFTPQVADVMINANRHAEVYRGFGFAVVPDGVGGFAGPLAGLHAGLAATSQPLVATVPCDSPGLPLDLVARLRGALEERGADLAVARTLDQPHPVFCLCRRSVLDHLSAFLAGGGRKIDRWYATLDTVEVPFDDQVEAFSNINTPEELARFEEAT
jgi:molybdopterin-guanine dinucleotide biosynthesis protein A